MKRLHLLRHAKSSWDDLAVDDHERPLAPRGRKAAAAMAMWLAEHEVRPQLVLCSTATRTRQTLGRLLPALGDPEIAYEDGLYHAGADALLERLRAVPGSTGEVLLVGHNPGLQELAVLLAAPGPQRERIEAKLPTGALVSLDVARLEPGGAEVTAFVAPRELDS